MYLFSALLLFAEEVSNWTYLLQLLGAGITGGGIWKLFDYLSANKQQNSADYSTIIQMLKEENENWKRTVEALQMKEEESRQRIIDLERLSSSLQSKLLLLESAAFDFPVPMWVKDLSGKMLALNEAYEQIFLKPKNLTAQDYIGKTDDKIWGKELAKIFQANDRKAFLTKIPVKETFIHELPDGSTEKYIIIKFIRYAGTLALGIGGIAVPDLES